MINFKGSISSSKSLVNRALLLEASEPNFKAHWASKALDVVLLKEALSNIQLKKEFYVGEGGTTFRFLSVFLSSFNKSCFIKAEKSLLDRPHEDLFDFFKFQKVDYEMTDNGLRLESRGWLNKSSLEASSFHTTQVATAVLLTALRFNSPFELKFKHELESDYFKMTVKLLKELGLELSSSEAALSLNEGSSLSTKNYNIGADSSSAAFMYTLGALNGCVEVENLNLSSYQPDLIVLDILKKSGVDVDKFKVSSKNLKKTYDAQDINLKSSPDLFPVLAAFFAFCEGESKLFGASQLVFKESNRIEEVYKLLSLCGYRVLKNNDGLNIVGNGLVINDHKPFDFDCSKDHRIYMCAYVLEFMGYKINIIGEESIKKSFPEFLDLKETYVFSNRS